MYFAEQFIEIGWTFIKASAVLILSLLLIDFWRRIILRLFKKPKGTKFSHQKGDGSKPPLDFFSLKKGGRNDPPSGDKNTH